MPAPVLTGPDDPGLDDAAFSALMSPLGPWPAAGVAAPVAVAVSGGADSLCLAILTATWAERRGIPLLALVVDHGLRPGSGQEAETTIARLGTLGIASRLLVLDGLMPGPRLAERARLARYDALRAACRTAGAVDLLLGHHASDQAETVLMRQRAASGPDGLAGMAPILDLGDVRLLRPLLRVPPARLRATLRRRGIGWIEDPSNQDRRAERTRSRATLAEDPDLREALLGQALVAGRAREHARRRDAETLAARVSLRPEGFALLPPDLVEGSVMAALIRTVGGRQHHPPSASVERLLRDPRSATLAGARMLPAGRLGQGWLLVREAAAMQGPVCAAPDAVWDGRFVLCGGLPERTGWCVAALGAQAGSLRRYSRLASAVLVTLPSVRAADGTLLAVPHLGWAAGPVAARIRVRFQPAAPSTESSAFSIL